MISHLQQKIQSNREICQPIHTSVRVTIRLITRCSRDSFTQGAHSRSMRERERETEGEAKRQLPKNAKRNSLFSLVNLVSACGHVFISQNSTGLLGMRLASIIYRYCVTIETRRRQRARYLTFRGRTSHYLILMRVLRSLSITTNSFVLVSMILVRVLSPPLC